MRPRKNDTSTRYEVQESAIACTSTACWTLVARRHQRLRDVQCRARGVMRLHAWRSVVCLQSRLLEPQCAPRISRTLTHSLSLRHKTTGPNACLRSSGCVQSRGGTRSSTAHSRIRTRAQSISPPTAHDEQLEDVAVAARAHNFHSTPLCASFSRSARCSAQAAPRQTLLLRAHRAASARAQQRPQRPSQSRAYRSSPTSAPSP